MTDNNIQKLYEVTETPKCGCKDKVTGIPCTYGSERWKKCDAEGMACPKEIWETAEPSFTVEKQLELIKWVSNFKVYESVKHKDRKWFMCASIGCNDYCESRNESFEQALASLILELWKDLTDDQKQEIKRILQ